MKILNESLAGLEVGLRHGLVKFDEQGIADIQPDDYAEELLRVPGFYKSNVVIAEDVKVVLDLEGIKEVQEEVVEEAPKYDLDKMTEKQLDALAKELEIEDYPKGANKGTKKAAIGTALVK